MKSGGEIRKIDFVTIALIIKPVFCDGGCSG
jgi:hypothetical protein